MKRNDKAIRTDVQAELEWDPRVHDAATIGIAVKNGITTLSGSVGSYAEKLAAEHAAESVTGVSAVANALVVRSSNGSDHTDEQIAESIVNALRVSTSIPEEHIKVAVDKGWVTLEGQVDYHHQREAAEQVIRLRIGVKGISNLLTLFKPVSANAVKSDIEAALRRIAEVDAKHVEVHADGHTVTLTGTVRSSAERKAAERAAWAAPGVHTVENRISIGG